MANFLEAKRKFVIDLVWYNLVILPKYFVSLKTLKDSFNKLNPSKEAGICFFMPFPPFPSF